MKCSVKGNQSSQNYICDKKKAEHNEKKGIMDYFS